MFQSVRTSGGGDWMVFFLSCVKCYEKFRCYLVDPLVHYTERYEQTKHNPTTDYQKSSEKRHPETIRPIILSLFMFPSPRMQNTLNPLILDKLILQHIKHTFRNSFNRFIIHPR